MCADQQAGHRRAGRAGQVGVHRAERRRRRQLVPRHHLGDHRPAQVGSVTAWADPEQEGGRPAAGPAASGRGPRSARSAPRPVQEQQDLHGEQQPAPVRRLSARVPEGTGASSKHRQAWVAVLHQAHPAGRVRLVDLTQPLGADGSASRLPTLPREQPRSRGNPEDRRPAGGAHGEVSAIHAGENYRTLRRARPGTRPGGEFPMVRHPLPVRPHRTSRCTGRLRRGGCTKLQRRGPVRVGQIPVGPHSAIAISTG